MARITPIEQPVSANMQTAFESVGKLLGFVPNSLRIMQLRPGIVEALAKLLAACWAPDSLVDGGFKRLIAYMSSHAAGCQYCVAHQVAGALLLNIDERKMAAIWDYETSPLYTARERVALDYARAGSLVPNEVTDAMFEKLKAHWSDAEIVEITGVVGAFGFLNRFNDSLATPLEPQAIGKANDILGRERWSPGKHA